MRKRISLLTLFLISLTGYAQYNDTLFYKSGNYKAVEIINHESKKLIYLTTNSRGEEYESYALIGTLKRYVIYDPENILQFDSGQVKTDLDNEQIRQKYPEYATVKQHALAINPFLIPFLSLNYKYTYAFGDKMQYSFISRGAYFNPLMISILSDNPILLGAGMKFTPFYNERTAFGFDLCPQIGFIVEDKESPIIIIPVSMDFDLLVNETFGVMLDFGFGSTIQDSSSDIYFRAFFGLSWQFGKTKTFNTDY